MHQLVNLTMMPLFEYSNIINRHPIKKIFSLPKALLKFWVFQILIGRVFHSHATQLLATSKCLVLVLFHEKPRNKPLCLIPQLKLNIAQGLPVLANLCCLKVLFQDLGVSHPQPMQLYYNNQVALHITKNSVLHKCTKHIEIDCHLVHKKLCSKIISTTHVPSYYQLADIFMKALGRDQFHPYTTS